MAATHGGEARSLRVGAALAGVVLAAVLLFSLGVMTGSRVALRNAELPTVPAPAAVIPPAAKPTVTPVSAESLTFYDRLSGAAPPLPAVPPAPPPAPAAGEASATPRTPAPSAAAAAPAERPAPPAPESGPAAVRPAVAARTPAGAGTGERVKRLMGKGPHALQVAAVTDRAAATEAAELLRRQGVPATTVTAVVKGRTWYRLRVGSFPSREAAARAAGILRAELGLDATPVRD